MMGGTVAFSIVLAVAIFMILPYYLSVFFQKFTDSYMLIAVLEGLIRLAIFIGYVAAISLMPDIKRVYMYHGAEHKCINCIEHGMDLTVENVRKVPDYISAAEPVFVDRYDHQYFLFYVYPCGFESVKTGTSSCADSGDCRCVL